HAARTTEGVRLRRLGEIDEVQRVSCPHRLRLAGLCELLRGILAHGLEQRKAGLVLYLARDHERAVHERREQVEHMVGRNGVVARDAFRGIEREAARKYGQSRKETTLVC